MTVVQISDYQSLRKPRCQNGSAIVIRFIGVGLVRDYWLLAA
jgi:hypothetical protein